MEKYKATIKILGKTYKATGSTIEDAIGGLKPAFAKGTSILTVENKGKKVEKVLGMAITARLFSPSPTVKQVHLKQVAMRFDL